MTIHEFNKCVDNFSDNIYRFLLKHIKDRDTAKDIVQDSYEKLWMQVDSISFEKAKSWLFTTAYHGMIDMFRRENRKEDFDDIDPRDYLFRSDYNNLKEILDHALNKLPEIQKSVILLRDYEGYSYDEIGKITGLNESQVKVYIYRARVFLKDYIKSPDLVI